MIQKILNKLTLGYFFKPKEIYDFNSQFAIVRTTETGINSNINDKFNKKISIFNSWNHYLNNSPRMEMPYTEEDAHNIIEVFEIPLIYENMGDDFEFTKGTNFGEIRNIVR